MKRLTALQLFTGNKEITMKAGQVFVRAKDPAGRWGSADVLDLDERSFRAWVLDLMMCSVPRIASIKPELVEGKEIEYMTAKKFKEEI